MNNDEQIKERVKEKYGEIALRDQQPNATACCGSEVCCTETYTMADKYDHLEGYTPDADLHLGCGLPTEFANINKGDTVVDLGSGAGNDCFIARHETGPTGKVIGVDFAEPMVDKARANAEKLGYANVLFTLGDIENIPLEEHVADVVVSNCVLNLVPQKAKAFNEIFRILKPGGHFSISDIVLKGILPEKLSLAAAMYVGCVAGAIQKADYLNMIKQVGFTNLALQKEKPIVLPDDILNNYLNSEEMATYNASYKEGIISSITIYGEKPLK